MMNKVLPLIAVLAITVNSCTCGNGRQASSGETAPQTTPDSLDRLLSSQGDTLMLSSQELTSFDRMLEAFGQKEEEDFLHEMTKPKDAFFFPEKDIKDNDLMRKVRLRYNYVAVMNRVLHSYEGFKRLATDVDFDEDSHYTLRDTLAWVKDLQPGLTESFVREQVSDTYAQDAALGILSAFRDFDGNVYEVNCTPGERSVAAAKDMKRGTLTVIGQDLSEKALAACFLTKDDVPGKA